MTDTISAIRSAATVILWRDHAEGPQVLMGMRGAAAVFMPSKYVFPGGGIDPEDHAAKNLPLSALCQRRLGLHCSPDAPTAPALCATAARELVEETGLILTNQTPSALQFVFRAITPPGRSRRFDARFFLANAASITGDTAHFSAASTELSHLQWIGVSDARRLDLPFITEVVLAETGAILRGHVQPGVPFFDNSGEVPTFRRLD